MGTTCKTAPHWMISGKRVADPVITDPGVFALADGGEPNI